MSTRNTIAFDHPHQADVHRWCLPPTTDCRNCEHLVKVHRVGREEERHATWALTRVPVGRAADDFRSERPAAAGQRERTAEAAMTLRHGRDVAADHLLPLGRATRLGNIVSLLLVVPPDGAAEEELCTKRSSASY